MNPILKSLLSLRASMLVRVALVTAMLALIACSNDMEDLKKEVEEIKSKSTEKIDALPPIKPYETFKYSAMDERSPFMPSTSGKANLANSIRPNATRPREFLEQFSLDTLQMVGTLDMSGKHYGLVVAKDGLVHHVQVGGHIGQADGRIVSITSTRISVIELVPDGMGGYIERPAALTLKE